jgi:hypothetical protein
MDSGQLRAAFLADVSPVLEAAGIELRQEMPWDEWNQLQRRLSR